MNEEFKELLRVFFDSVCWVCMIGLIFIVLISAVFYFSDLLEGVL